MSTVVKCPTCKTPTEYTGNPFRPFCSERCKLIDLGAWASGDYSIPCIDQSVEEEQEEL